LGNYLFQNKPLPGVKVDPGHSLSRDLKGVWLFNEAAGFRVNDLSGGKSFGAFSAGAATYPTWSTGKFGAAINFGANDEFIDMRDEGGLDFGLNDFSFVIRLKFPPNANTTVIVAKRTPGAAAAAGWYLLLLNTGLPYLQLGDNINFATLSANTAVDDNEWHQVAFVFNRAGNGEIYIDGLLDNSGDISNVTGSVSNSLTFTVRKGFGAAALYGDAIEIDYVLAYERVLLTSEVSLLNSFPYILMQNTSQWWYNPPPAVGGIMNQLQGPNLGADLYDGTLLGY
jgi:hypothetical protein